MEELLPTSVFGLPLHPLVVHGAVVLVPLAAGVVLLAAVLRRFRRWAGWLPLALAATAVVLAQVAATTGGTLQSKLPTSVTDGAAVREHAQVGDSLVWWVLPLVLVALATYAVERRDRDSRTGTPRGVALVIAVAGVLLPLAAVWQTVQVGHSGATAVWGYVKDL